MKNYFLLTFSVILFSINFLSSQELVKNEKDEFTGQFIKETDWISFQMASKNYSYIRLRRIDSVLHLNFKIITHKIVAVDEGAPLMFKLANDDVVKLENLHYSIASVGGGSTGLSWSKIPGITLTFKITEAQLLQLKNNIAVKTRLYTSGGYIEGKISENKYNKFIELINLILD